MKRVFSLLAGAAAIFASYMAVIFGLPPAQSLGSGTIGTIALPGLVTGLVATWLIATEARSAHMTAVQIHELHVQLARRDVDLARVATHDDLTGLYSRSHFDQAIERELERAKRIARPFAVLLIEVDGLDVFSERADSMRRGYVLSEVASLLEAGLSMNDTGSRYADCCFAVLLPEKDTADAMDVAKGIQTQLEHREFYGRGDVIGSTLSASQGIAAFPAPGMETVRDLEEAAEGALLEAKLAGGATIRIYTAVAMVSDVEREPLAS